MDDTILEKKEEAINIRYSEFLEEVREAFDRHCDKIKASAEKKISVIPEEDEEGRQKVLDEEKTELDKTLAELKQLLAKKSAKVRTQLEEIANLRDQEDFDLESQLAEVEKDDDEHTA